MRSRLYWTPSVATDYVSISARLNCCGLLPVRCRHCIVAFVDDLRVSAGAVRRLHTTDSDYNGDCDRNGGGPCACNNPTATDRKHPAAVRECIFVELS